MVRYQEVEQIFFNLHQLSVYSVFTHQIRLALVGYSVIISLFTEIFFKAITYSAHPIFEFFFITGDISRDWLQKHQPPG